MEQESHLDASKRCEVLTAWLGFSLDLEFPLLGDSSLSCTTTKLLNRAPDLHVCKYRHT